MRVMTTRLTLTSLLVSFALAAAVPAAAGILDDVRDRGYVKCAIGNRPVGDTRIGETGYEGFFPEFCRVIARPRRVRNTASLGRLPARASAGRSWFR